MKTYTEQDLRLAFQAGEDFGRHNAYDSNLLDEDEYITYSMKKHWALTEIVKQMKAEYEKKREKIGFKIKKLYKFENIFMNRIRKKYDKYYNKEDHNFKYKD